mmetsp:Transcript_15825/g.34251  ORF Transcript_15825/g.34251 Transcript_15825/m.34251 type:complete len:169 (+) Transcript_15825:99-605(+)
MTASIKPIDELWEIELGKSKSEVEEEQTTIDKQDEKSVSRRCWIIAIVITVVMIAAAVVLGIVFGVVKKDGSSVGSSFGSSGQPYNVEIHWQASTYDGWKYGFVEWGTNAIVPDGGEAWDEKKEFGLTFKTTAKRLSRVKFITSAVSTILKLEAISLSTRGPMVIGVA